MTNHILLVIQVGEIPLSRIIQNLSFRYTRSINYQRKQFWHLFEGRYKAILIDVDNYMLELVRYLHTNPVRAGMVDTPGRYTWSSHTAYLKTVRVTWLLIAPVLSQYSIKLKDLQSNSRQRKLTEDRTVAALIVREVPYEIIRWNRFTRKQQLFGSNR